MRAFLSLVGVAASCLGAQVALAQQPEPNNSDEPSPAPPDTQTTSAPEQASPNANQPTDGANADTDTEHLPPLPSATDTLGGHFVAAAGGGVVLPFGRLQRGLRQSRVLGTGYALDLDLGVGISRTVAAGVWGEYGGYGTGSRCDDCAATTMAFGAFIRYHLVQGVRFDPWISAGIGYRMTKIETDASSFEYTGLDLLRLKFGGDWYAFKNLGFGPFIQLDTGLYGKRPDDISGLVDVEGDESTLHFAFTLGARISLDTPGK
jgi:hypothetical protein